MGRTDSATYPATRAGTNILDVEMDWRSAAERLCVVTLEPSPDLPPSSFYASRLLDAPELRESVMSLHTMGVGTSRRTRVLVRDRSAREVVRRAVEEDPDLAGNVRMGVTQSENDLSAIGVAEFMNLLAGSCGGDYGDAGTVANLTGHCYMHDVGADVTFDKDDCTFPWQVHPCEMSFSEDAAGHVIADLPKVRTFTSLRKKYLDKIWFADKENHPDEYSYPWYTYDGRHLRRVFDRTDKVHDTCYIMRQIAHKKYSGSTFLDYEAGALGSKVAKWETLLGRMVELYGDFLSVGVCSYAYDAWKPRGGGPWQSEGRLHDTDVDGLLRCDYVGRGVKVWVDDTMSKVTADAAVARFGEDAIAHVPSLVVERVQDPELADIALIKEDRVGAEIRAREVAKQNAKAGQRGRRAREYVDPYQRSSKALQHVSIRRLSAKSSADVVAKVLTEVAVKRAVAEGRYALGDRLPSGGWSFTQRICWRTNGDGGKPSWETWYVTLTADTEDTYHVAATTVQPEAFDAFPVTDAQEHADLFMVVDPAGNCFYVSDVGYFGVPLAYGEIRDALAAKRVVGVIKYSAKKGRYYVSRGVGDISDSYPELVGAGFLRIDETSALYTAGTTPSMLQDGSRFRRSVRMRLVTTDGCDVGLFGPVLEMMGNRPSVMRNRLTVLPFPYKYIREWTNIELRRGGATNDDPLGEVEELGDEPVQLTFMDQFGLGWFPEV